MKIDMYQIENKNYFLGNKIKLNGNTYLFLINELDNLDIIIRKVIKENNEEFLIGLKDEKEFELVMKTYLERFNN